jgi:hypothetical protein
MQKEGHVFYTAANDAALEQFIDNLNATVLWQSVCWNGLEAACDAKEHATAKISGYAKDGYYQKRAIEETFSEFVQKRSEKGMIVVGESGMGKTTLLVHLASGCSKEKHLYRMFNGAEFTPGRPLEAQLVNGLGFKKSGRAEGTCRVVLANDRCGRRKTWKALAHFYRRHQRI